VSVSVSQSCKCAALQKAFDLAIDTSHSTLASVAAAAGVGDGAVRVRRRQQLLMFDAYMTRKARLAGGVRVAHVALSSAAAFGCVFIAFIACSF